MLLQKGNEYIDIPDEVFPVSVNEEVEDDMSETCSVKSSEADSDGEENADACEQEEIVTETSEVSINDVNHDVSDGISNNVSDDVSDDISNHVGDDVRD